MKKRIAFVTNKLVVGGVERALITLLDSIDYQQYEVTLWTKGMGGEFEELLNPNVIARNWDQVVNPLSLCLKTGQFKAFFSGIYRRLMLRYVSKNWLEYEYHEARMKPSCDNLSYDCVIAYQGLYSGVMATALFRLHAPIKIAWIHGQNHFDATQKKLMSKIYKLCNHICCVSEATRQAFVQDFPETTSKAQVVYNLIDHNRIRSLSLEDTEVKFDRNTLVTVGRLSLPKGQNMIPKTTRILLDAGYNIHWYLVGDGELRAEIEEAIQKYNVQSHVILLGSKMNPYPYIKNCDIYVQPSFSEGYCTTTVEAKILCKPIVTTDAPGMREQFINGENGLIVNSMTPEALAEGIKLLLDNLEMPQKFQSALIAESYDNSNELQKIYNFIEWEKR